MSYKMQADVNYELCFGCEFDADGTRIQATDSDGAEAGKVVAGSTCGGYPNGWCVARQLDYSSLDTILHLHPWVLFLIKKQQPLWYWSLVLHWLDAIFN